MENKNQPMPVLKQFKNTINPGPIKLPNKNNFMNLFIYSPLITFAK